MIYSKRYVTVDVQFRDNGQMLPKKILWNDEYQYPIEGVKVITPAPALKAGGQGDRYTICVLGQERYLFFERSAALFGNELGRWFVEVGREG